MKSIPLSQGKVALVDDEDFKWLSEYTWHVQKDKNTFYASRSVNLGNRKTTSIKMHREIMNARDANIQIDHKDHDGLNNQKSNLRICSRQANAWNRKKVLSSCASSSYKGVSFLNGKWVSRITVSGRVMRLGLFSSEVDAAMAYDTAALNNFHDFTHGNFIEV